MGISYKTFGLREVLPKNILMPDQVHGNKIVEIITRNEDLTGVDGIYSHFTDDEKRLLLGIKTADCAPVVFWDDDKYGVIHVGWRGLVNGIVENMCKIFDDQDTDIWVGPMLPIFEIQRDECYKIIEQKFGSKFFSKANGQMFFHFQEALASLIPEAEFDGRSTFEDETFASWRRDQDDRRNVTLVMGLG